MIKKRTNLTKKDIRKVVEESLKGYKDPTIYMSPQQYKIFDEAMKKYVNEFFKNNKNTYNKND